MLAYLDKPWKVVAVALLALLGAAGWVLYEKREILIDAWLKPASVELQEALVPAALAMLVQETDADLVQVWMIDLDANSQRFIAGRNRDGERTGTPTPQRLPIFGGISDIRALVEFLEGRATCADLSPQGPPLVRRLVERGMRRACGVPITAPPDRFIGVIYLAWQTPGDAISETIAIGAAREAATQLVTH
jgi:hypothetical protein